MFFVGYHIEQKKIQDNLLSDLMQLWSEITAVSTIYKGHILSHCESHKVVKISNIF